MQLVRNLAVEWGPHNIRVNAIAPGLIKTKFAKALWSNPVLARKLEDFRARQRDTVLDMTLPPAD